MWTYSDLPSRTSPPITEETKNPDRYRILGSRVDTECIDAVSYTHLTLPTILLV